MVFWYQKFALYASDLNDTFLQNYYLQQNKVVIVTSCQQGHYRWYITTQAVDLDMQLRPPRRLSF